MNFNSYFFVLVFFPIAIIGYHMLNKLNHNRLGKWFLVLMSLWFYGYAGLQGLFIICATIAVNYGIYLLYDRLKSKKTLMVFGVIIDILALIYFKYLIFIEITVNQLMGTSFTYVGLLAPLGISFITFSQISFLIDSYKISSKVSFTDYVLYVLFFPKVTVGPIALSGDFIKEINKSSEIGVDWDNIAKGLYAFTLGLSKKVLIADSLAHYADWGFSNIEGLGSINALIIMLSYTMQIYFDFSGFCDMAAGISKMLNIDIPMNFNSPYRALSIGEFWDRWHITLTKFFTKYVYISLGGSRKGKIRTYINILIVFLISGIWHGAAVTFIIWGLLHGIASIIDRMISAYTVKIPKVVRWFVTFLFVNVAWVFFRARTAQDAMLFLKELVSFKLNPINIELVAKATPKGYEFIQWIITEFTEVNAYYSGLPIILFILAASIFASIKLKNTNERINDFVPSKRKIAITVILFVWCIISLSEISTFIYVNF